MEVSTGGIKLVPEKISASAESRRQVNFSQAKGRGRGGTSRKSEAFLSQPKVALEELHRWLAAVEW
jgi:hypothetical protein